MCRMSRSAAPDGEVITPMRCGNRGRLRFQALELALERADARLLQVLDDELVLAPRLVDADAAANQHLRAGTGREADERVLRPEHRAAQLRVPVLEGEVPVAGGRLREVRQFPLNPQHTEPALQQRAHLAVHTGDAVHLPGRRGPGAVLAVYGHQSTLARGLPARAGRI